MARSKLTTDRQIAALKPSVRPYENTAGGARGLIVRTFPSGLRVFELRYVTVEGVRRRLPLGDYPGLSLADAVKRALSYGVAVSDGSDPAALRAAEKHQARTGETLTELADAYFLAAAKGLHGGRGRPKRPSTIKVERIRFDVRVKPALGEKRFAHITRSDVKQFMRCLASESGLAADTISSIGRTLSSILAFAVHEERLDVNPATGLTQPLAPMPRDRMFGEPALRALWLELSGVRANLAEAGLPSRAIPLALKLALITLTRRQEVAGARWDEFDMRTRVWTIPAGRHKSRRVHVVPLSNTAVAILDEAASLLDHTGNRTAVVFPSPVRSAGHVVGSSREHISEHAMTRAMSRLCAALKLPHGSPHDFRRTGATLMTSEQGGVRRFIVSKVLAHAAHEGAVVTEVYDRNEYLAEKRWALEVWERLLLDIVAGRDLPRNVLSFGGGQLRGARD